LRRLEGERRRLRGLSNHFIGLSLVPETVERDTWGMRPRMARSTVSVLL
jgi:hypothetical protein